MDDLDVVFKVTGLFIVKQCRFNTFAGNTARALIFVPFMQLLTCLLMDDLDVVFKVSGLFIVKQCMPTHAGQVCQSFLITENLLQNYCA